SLSRDNLILSYQIWQDEGAMTAWRVHAHHHDIQTLGRDKVFSDYRLRVAEMAHEVKPGHAAWQPERRGTYNDPKRRAPTYVLAVETAAPQLSGVKDLPVASFSSVYREGRFAHLVELPDEPTGLALSTQLLAEPDVDNIRVVGINPGPVGTDRHVTLLKTRARQQFGDESRYTEFQKGLPLGRPAHVREIADLMAFLASDRAGYTSGVIYTVDGGISAGWG
ncbi:MAG: SDR family oxidoreductase, partial [Bradyrhizobium sp.]|nr:SDR family oxidoreductase [Bradyrhizobium sp.]